MTLTEGKLASLLFFLVAVPTSSLPLFLGMRGATIIAVMSLLLLGFAVWKEVQKDEATQPIRWPILVLSFGMAFLLCVLGGEGHFFYANPDWLYRDAVLLDLAHQSWPVTYNFQHHDWLLRAPLGMYMLPAFAEKISGLSIAVMGLLVQNVILFSLIFYFLVPKDWSLRNSSIVIFVFCIYGGWHIFGFIIRYFNTQALMYPSTFWEVILTPQVHVDWWAAPNFQYPPAITQIFWVPNHTIPAWAFVCLYLRMLRAEASAALVLACVPAFAFWSPLASIGMVPFAAYAVFKTLAAKRLMADMPIVLCGAIASLPVFIYEGLASSAVYHDFLVKMPFFWAYYTCFIMVAVVPVVVLILWNRGDQKTIYDTTLAIAVAVLLCLPFYKVGLANDFVMRAASPALAILAAILGIQLCIKGRHVWKSAAVISLIIGSVVGMLEIHRVVITERTAVTDCNLIQIWQMTDPVYLPAHYIIPMNSVPSWLVAADPASIPTNETASCPVKKS